jgi:hypothetical protein
MTEPTAPPYVRSLTHNVGATLVLLGTVWTGYRAAGVASAVLMGYSLPLGVFLGIYAFDIATAGIPLLPLGAVLLAAVVIGAVTAVPYGLLGYVSGVGLRDTFSALRSEEPLDRQFLASLLAAVGGLALFVLLVDRFGIMFTGFALTG